MRGSQQYTLEILWDHTQKPQLGDPDCATSNSFCVSDAKGLTTRSGSEKSWDNRGRQVPSLACLCGNDISHASDCADLSVFTVVVVVYTIILQQPEQ